jgi:hypothetical protein
MLVCLVSTTPLYAALEWSIDSAILIDDEALDIAESPDGQRLFVLTNAGKIIVMNRLGQVESTIDGPFNADRLSVSNDGKRLFLVGKGEKRLQVVSLLDRFNIPVGGSPVKGDIAAAVTVAVFSDFQ